MPLQRIIVIKSGLSHYLSHPSLMASVVALSDEVFFVLVFFVAPIYYFILSQHISMYVSSAHRTLECDALKCILCNDA